MVSNNSVWPPPGWKVVVKSKNGRKVKYYFNSKTRQKFYSKPSLLRFIKDGCESDEKPQPVIEHAKEKSGDLQMHLAEENGFDWLPTGWNVERRIRKSGARAGTEYKCYIDSSTGSKFFSKPEVMRYLKSKQRIAETSKVEDRKRSRHSINKRIVDPVSAHKSNLEPKVSQISKTRVRKSLSSGNLKVVTERTVDEDLPSGWIKETRIKMLGNKVVRRDPFLYDPASRLVFRSKLEVLRYVETGEISKHAYQRKSESVIGENSANGKTSTSSKHEETPKSRTRNKLFAGESSSKQSIEELQEASGNKKVEGRDRRRLSSRGKAATAGTSSLSILSPKSPSDSQELVVAKPLKEQLSGTKDSLGITKHAPSEVQDDGAEVATRLLPEENQVTPAVQECNNGKASTSERKTNTRKLLSVPSRSSKRLAGVEAKVEFHSIPIEHALRASSRKPFRTKPISSLESVTDEVQEKCQDVDKQNVPVYKEVKHQTDEALQATRRSPSRTKPISSLESVPDELQEKCLDVDKKNVPVSKEVEHQTVEALQATRRKPSRAKPISSLELVPDELQEKCQDVVDKQNMFVSKEVKHQTVEVNAVSIITTQGEPTNTIDDLPSQKEKHHTVNVNSDTELATKGESSTKIDDFTSEEQNHCLLNVDPDIVLAAVQGEASSQIDKGFIAKDTLLVDLSDLQLEEAPPGFSDNMKFGVSSVKIKQSFEHPSDTLQGSKVENSSRERPIVEEKPASVVRETEQPQSEYCFPPPLWSDPCLEFAFKTLTGAIPFDDNLAIQDYIQHQLRTSEENDNNQCLPDVCAPSVRKSDETNRVPQLPEDVNVPNFTQFGSPEIKQVQNK